MKKTIKKMMVLVFVALAFTACGVNTGIMKSPCACGDYEHGKNHA